MTKDEIRSALRKARYLKGAPLNKSEMADIFKGVQVLGALGKTEKTVIINKDPVSLGDILSRLV